MASLLRIELSSVNSNLLNGQFVKHFRMHYCDPLHQSLLYYPGLLQSVSFKSCGTVPGRILFTADVAQQTV